MSYLTSDQLLAKLRNEITEISVHQLNQQLENNQVTLVDIRGREEWDQGNDHFPPTSFQVANLNVGTGAENVIPGRLTAQFNLRFSSELTEADIRRRVTAILDSGDFDYELTWRLSGNPFLTPAGELVQAAREAIPEITGQPTELSTSGGTSDGRFISPAGVDVVELGPVSASIHKIDEHVRLADVATLTSMYQRILELLLDAAASRA